MRIIEQRRRLGQEEINEAAISTRDLRIQLNRGEVLRIIEERRGLAQQEMNENTEANGDIDFIDDDVYVESRKSPTQSKGVKQGKQTKRNNRTI